MEKLQVLVADDNKALLDGVRRNLGDKVELHTFHDAGAAVSFIKQHGKSLDVVFCDSFFEAKNEQEPAGADVLKAFRDNKKESAIFFGGLRTLYECVPPPKNEGENYYTPAALAAVRDKQENTHLPIAGAEMNIIMSSGNITDALETLLHGKSKGLQK